MKLEFRLVPLACVGIAPSEQTLILLSQIDYRYELHVVVSFAFQGSSISTPEIYEVVDNHTLLQQPPRCAGFSYPVFCPS